MRYSEEPFIVGVELVTAEAATESSASKQPPNLNAFGHARVTRLGGS